MTIEFEDLRVFLAAAEHGSFGRAAAALGLAQPSVSNRLAGLERRLGRPLFSRSTRGAALTPAGERLVPYARRVLQLVEDAQAATRMPHHLPPVRVVLAVSYAPVLVPAVVDTLASTDRPLSISYDHGPSIVRAIATGEADIGFLAPCPHPTSVVVRPLDDSPVVAVAAPRHPLSENRRPSLADLAAHPIAFSAWGDGIETFLDQLPGDARVQTVLPVPAAAQLARERGFITLAPKAALAADLRERALRQLEVRNLPTATVPLALAFHRTSTEPISDLVAAARRALHATSP